MRITLYKPIMPHIEEIKKHLSALGIRVVVSRPVLQFFNLFNPNGNSDTNKLYPICYRKRCHQWEGNGELSMCAIPFLFRRFDKYFGTSIHELVKDGLINIHNKELDGFSLKKKLMEPINACNYCTEPEWFDWDVSKDIKMEDFFTGVNSKKG